MRHFIAAIAVLVAFGQVRAAELTIYAVNGPMAYFVKRLAGETAEVVMPVPGDSDPAFWQPGPEDIAAVQAADLIVLNGAGYAKWTAAASLPRARLIDPSKGLEDRFITEESVATHSHGGGNDHSHAGLAFTTWLDFELAAGQAANIAAGLKRKLKGQEGEIDANLDSLKSDLAELHKKADALGATLADVPLVASHPIYQYFQKAYGLSLLSLTWEPDVSPDEQQLAELDALIADAGVAFMIWENTPIDEAAAAVAERGLTNLVFKTGNAAQPNENLIELWRRGLAELGSAVR